MGLFLLLFAPGPGYQLGGKLSPDASELCSRSVGGAGTPSDKGSRSHSGAISSTSCAAVFGRGGTRPSPAPPRLIEIRPMDRETARRNMKAGLVAGGIAAGIFALSFVAAFLYIAQ